MTPLLRERFGTQKWKVRGMHLTKAMAFVAKRFGRVAGGKSPEKNRATEKKHSKFGVFQLQSGMTSWQFLNMFAVGMARNLFQLQNGNRYDIM